MRKVLNHPVVEYLWIFIGVASYSFGLITAIRPIDVPAGGLTGIAQVINYLTGFPMGVLILLMNLPLFILSLKHIGKKFLIRTLVATVSMSLFIDFLTPFADQLQLTEDKFLSVLYGGFLMGFGIGLTLMKGATTGGTDILSKLITRKYSHLSMGRVNLVTNAVIMIGAAIVYRSAENALYAICVQFISSSVIDMLLTGMDHASAALIVTRNPKNVSDAIFSGMNRGVTGLDSHGMYTGNETETLLCAVRYHELTTLKQLIHSVDPDSFVIFLNAREVMGRGFKAFGES